MSEQKPKAEDPAWMGCAGTVVLVTIVGLHHFADSIWGRTPAVLNWLVIGLGGILLIGLICGLIVGKTSERVSSAVLLLLAVLIAGLSIFTKTDVGSIVFWVWIGVMGMCALFVGSVLLWMRLQTRDLERELRELESEERPDGEGQSQPPPSPPQS